jgi:uncharacterized membrane protein YfbV (UPF0208 family)
MSTRLNTTTTILPCKIKNTFYSIRVMPEVSALMATVYCGAASTTKMAAFAIISTFG